MLTKVGKIMVGNFVIAGASSYQAIPGVYTQDIRRAIIHGQSSLGNWYYLNPGPSTNPSTSIITSTLTETSSGVAFGSGNTPPTENDHTLETPIYGLSGTVNLTTEYDSTNFRFSRQLEYTISNNTGADVIIREIGKFVTSYTSSTKGASTTSNAKSFLVDRTVLDTPVTIPNGEASIVRYVFEFPGDTE